VASRQVVLHCTALLLCVGALFPGHTYAQDVIRGICIANDHSRVDCRGVTFTISTSDPQAKKFIIAQLERVVSHAVEPYSSDLNRQNEEVVALKEKFDAGSQQIADLAKDVALLHAQTQSAGAIHAELPERDLLEKRFAMILGQVADTKELRDDVAELERRLDAYERSRAQVWTYERNDHRLRTAFQATFDLGSTTRLTSYGGFLAWRPPLVFLLELRLGIAGMSGKSQTAITGTESPRSVEKARSDVSGWSADAAAFVGYEWRLVAVSASLGRRRSWLTYDAPSIGRDRDVRASEFVSMLSLDFRLVSGLIASGGVGMAWLSTLRSPVYSYDLLGGDLDVRSGHHESTRFFAHVGASYAFSL
jgi:hypothetical protein